MQRSEQPAAFFKHLTILAARWTRSDRSELVLEDALQRRLARGSDAVQALQEDDAASHWIFDKGEPLGRGRPGTDGLGTVPRVPDDGYRAFLGLPVITDGVVRGALCVRNLASRPYDRGEVEVMGTLASLVALAVTHYELGRRLSKILSGAGP